MLGLGLAVSYAPAMFREAEEWRRILKTAKALGFTIPQSILLRVDEVIE